MNRAGSGAATWLPVVLAVLSIAMTAAGAVLMVVNGQPILGTFNLDLIVVGTAFVVLGAFLVRRVPGNVIGWLMLVAGLLWSADLVVAQVARYGVVTEPGSVSNVGLWVWLSNWIWTPGTALLLFAIPLVFPDGRLPSRRWRPVVALGVAIVVIELASHAAAAWIVRNDVATVIGTFDASTVPGPVGLLSAIGDSSTFLVLPPLGAAALIARYRSARGVVRQQVRWFALAVVVAIVLVMADMLIGQLVPEAMGLLGGVALALIPVAIGTAILRYRLYDLDRIISRTVAWALVTGLLVAVFVGVVVMLEAVLTPLTSGSTFAVAVSTLVAFAAFQPLRRRVHGVVDRRFDRARYDARNTASSFAQRLRSETDMDLVMRDLASVTASAVAPASFAVWLRPKALGR